MSILIKAQKTEVGRLRAVRNRIGSELHWRRFTVHRKALKGVPVFSILILALVMAAAILGSYVVPHDPLTGNLLEHDLPPAWLDGGNPEFLLGTDTLGRDIFSRIIAGARISLIVSAVSIALGGILGTVLG